MSFLIDTDTCSAYVKGDRAVVNRFAQYSGGLHISAVTLGELLTWALRAQAPPRRRQEVEDLVNLVTVLDVTADVGRKFGEVRAALFDAGTPAPDSDLLNAAIALVHNLTMITHNTADYLNVPGLRLDDWLIP
jgi:predicted nucleic acid-binding protein